MAEEIRLYEYDYDKPELTETFLAHHQIKGAKWGVMHGPPYPLGSDSSTGATLKKGATVKKKSRHEERVEARKKKKLNKKRAKTLAKAREMKRQNQELKKAQKERDDAIRKKALDNNDIETIYNNQKLFTKDEIKGVIDNYETNQKLKNLMEKEKQAKNEKVYQRIQTIQKYANTGAQLMSNLSTFYESYNKVASAMNKQGDDEAVARKEAFKKKIMSERDLKTAYENRNLFTSNELSELMKSSDQDAALKEKLKTWDPSSKATGPVKQVKQGTKAQSQIDQYRKDDAKRAAKVEKNLKFKDRADYEATREAAERSINYDYYNGTAKTRKNVTDADVIDWRRQSMIRSDKAKAEAKERQKSKRKQAVKNVVKFWR